MDPQGTVAQKGVPNDTDPVIIEEKVSTVNGEQAIKKYKRG